MIVIIVAPLGTISILRGLSSSGLTRGSHSSVALRLAPGSGEIPLVLHEQGGVVVVSSLVTSPGPVITSPVPNVPIAPVGRLHEGEGGGH